MAFMSGNKKNREPERPAVTEEPKRLPVVTERAAIISKSMVVDGNLSLDEPIEIYGCVNGHVTSKSAVSLHNGRVTGNVQAESLSMRGGKITGPVQSKLSVVLSEGATIEGDVSAGQIRIEANASIVGNLSAHELFVGERGEILGDVETQLLKTEDGSILNGSVKMKKGMDDVLAALETPEEPPVEAPVLPIME